MSVPDRLSINTSEEFPHLSKAPITEAVIAIRAQSSVPWKEEEVLAKLKPHLTDYPHFRSGRLRELGVKIEDEPKAMMQDLGWLGFMFTSSDDKQIAKFQFDLFSLSRLHPYEDWDTFSGEALRLWKLHVDITQPVVIERLGVRFINRFALPPNGSVLVSDYFKAHADDLPELKLELASFFHHETMVMPSNPYAMNVIKTAQSAEASGTGPAFILDIDVYTREPFGADVELLERRLAEMHWLKNKAFFGIITNKLLRELRKMADK